MKTKPKGRPNKTRYLGVKRAGKERFYAYIRNGSRKVYCGTGKTAREAALRYDAKARKLFGEKAITNFSNREQYLKEKVLDHVKNNPEATLRDIREVVGGKAQYLDRAIESLELEGRLLVVRNGPGKPNRYLIFHPKPVENGSLGREFSPLGMYFYPGGCFFSLGEYINLNTGAQWAGFSFGWSKSDGFKISFFERLF